MGIYTPDFQPNVSRDGKTCLDLNKTENDMSNIAFEFKY